MKAIRGATTVDFDGCEQIRERVKELLSDIKKANNLDNEDISCIMFSNTSDIRSRGGLCLRAVVFLVGA